jgi:secondary thiamine-phosphate synthase enzyme
MLNENADPSVRADMERFMSLVVPEGPSAPWQHTDEGYDDMPAHCKAAMFGSSLTLPIRQGRLAIGTWQGVWLAEHRNEPSSRTLIITLQGMGSS